ncbi:hypothetical protein, partial [Dietzia kunjamensis]
SLIAQIQAGSASGSGEGSSELPELPTESLEGGSDDLGSVTESLGTGSGEGSSELPTESLEGGSDDLGS